MNVRQYVQGGLDEADRAESTPWNAAEIIQKTLILTFGVLSDGSY